MGQEVHSEGWKRSRGTGGVGSPPRQDGRISGPSREPGGVGRDRRGWESLLEGRERSVVLPRGLGGVRCPSWRDGRAGRNFRRTGRGQEAIQKGRER